MWRELIKPLHWAALLCIFNVNGIHRGTTTNAQYIWVYGFFSCNFLQGLRVISQAIKLDKSASHSYKAQHEKNPNAAQPRCYLQFIFRYLWHLISKAWLDIKSIVFSRIKFNHSVTKTIDPFHFGHLHMYYEYFHFHLKNHFYCPRV